MGKLLLVDITVNGYKAIVNAAAADVKCVLFSRSEDTFTSLQSKIDALGPATYETVGIVQHGSDYAEEYSMFDKEKGAVVENVQVADPNLITWNKFASFIIYLKQKHSTKCIDLISCMIYNNPNWIYIFNKLEAGLRINLRASSDMTGNLMNGGNWVMESDNVNIADIYFTEKITVFKNLLYDPNESTHSTIMISKTNTRKWPLVNGTTVKSNNMHIFKRAQSLIDSWGSLGVTKINPPTGTTNIRAIAASRRAYVGITTNDTLVSWGDISSASLPAGITDVDVIAANYFTFCALKKDGSLAAWGYNASFDQISGTIPANISGASDYIAIVAQGRAFAALKSNRTVVAWGNPQSGGFIPSGLSNVAAIDTIGGGFVALKQDGSVAIWTTIENGVQTISGLPNIVSIYGSYFSEFLALDASGIAYYFNGSSVSSYNNSSPVVAVCPSLIGGYICLCENNTIFRVYIPLSPTLSATDYTNIKGIVTRSRNVALLKLNGDVVYSTFDDTSFPSGGLTNVNLLASNYFAMTAIKTDNSVVCWGDIPYGGLTPSPSTNISSVFGMDTSFVAIKTDKSLIGWGDGTYSGANVPSNISNVDNIIAAKNAAAAFRNMPITMEIETQPLSQTVMAGASILFSVGLSGESSPTFQWKKNGIDISGATSASLTLSNVQGSNTGYYTVIVVDGTTTRISSAAVLTVITPQPPVITGQPSSVVVLDGSSASFSVVATGSNLTYQWKRNGIDISGATSASYTVAIVSSANTGSYTVVVSNADGSVTSGAATLAIGTSPVITTQPVSRIVLAGASTSLSVVATGTAPLSYQWKKGGASISGATSATYTIATVRPADIGAYSVVVSNSLGSVESSVVSVSTGGAPIITSQPERFPNVSGSITLSVDVSGTAPFTYQWFKDNQALFGSTNSTYTIAAVSQATAGLYRVRVSNTLGSTLSDDSTIAAPRILQQPTSSGIVSNATTLSVDASGNQPISYQWRLNGTAINGATSASYAISDVAAAAGTYTVVVSNAAGSRTSQPFGLASAPVIVRQPGSRTAQAGTNVRFGVLASGQNLSYDWRKNGVSLSATSQPFFAISDISSGDAGVYSVVITNSSGTTTSANATLTVITAPAPTKEELREIVKTGAAPINTPITFTQTVNSVAKDFVSQTKQPDPSTRVVEVIPTEPEAPRTIVANIPQTVAKVAVSAIPAPIINNESGQIRTVIDFKFFDENDNKISDFADNPIAISVQLPAIFSATTLNVYRVDDATGAETFAGTAIYNVATGKYDVTLTHFTTYVFGATTVPCFTMGTRILTATGFKKVEELTREDRIMTSDGRAVPFARAHRVVQRTTFDDAPFHIPAHTFGRNMPPADCTLSPSHAFQSAPGVWQFPELAAKKYPAIRQISLGERVVYFHIKLPNYLTDNIVLEGGVVAESFGGEELATIKGLFRYDSAAGGYRRKTADAVKHASSRK